VLTHGRDGEYGHPALFKRRKKAATVREILRRVEGPLLAP